jgi:tetratricopeptide (TPR) repeat protein
VTRPLFEQYKDALRQGHLAARAGRIDEALAAYVEAGRLAPDRAAPHTSRATVLHRAGRDPEAFAAFDKALEISPDDDATLRARAVTFREMGRLASAAADLERLAEAFDADGRRADALTTAREALAITATPARRALVQRLEEPVDEAVPRQVARRQPAKVEPRAPAPAPAARAPEAKPEPSVVEAALPESATAEPAAAEPGAEEPLAAEAVAAKPVTAEPEPTPAPSAPAPGTSSTLMDLYDAPIDEAVEAPPSEIAAAAPDLDLAAALASEPDVEPPPESRDVVSAPGGSLMDLYDAPIEGGPETDAVAAAVASPVFEGATEDLHAAPLVPEMAALNAPVPGRISLDPSARDPGSDFLIQLEPDADPSAAIPWPAIDLPSAPPPPIVGPPPDPEGLMAEALALIDSGDAKAARNLLLTAVMVHRAAGRPDAAIDVCLQLLALFPGDAHVHLAIAGLQLDRGWRILATEKIQLLLRLTALTGDTQAEADAHALMAERIHDEGPASFARA